MFALRQWYEVWSTIARVAIKRRDRLIQLGLAHRKSPAEPAEPEVGGAKASEAGRTALVRVRNGG